MIFVYVRLQVARWQTSWRSSTFQKLLLLGKLVLLTQLVVACLQYSRAAPLIARMIDSDVLLPSIWEHLRRELFMAAAIIGATIPVLGIRIWEPLQSDPFWRFGSPFMFVVRSRLYPLLSVATISLAVSAVALFGASGILYFLAAYIAHTASLSAPRSTLIALSFLAVNTVVGASTEVLLIIICVLLLLALVTPFMRLTVTRVRGTVAPLIRVTTRNTGQRSLLRHEWAYLRSYPSDQAYIALGILAGGFCLYTLARGAIMRGPTTLQWWLLLCFPLVPFITIVFNLMGADTHVLPRLLRDPERAAEMYVRRLGAYRLAMYGANAPVIWLLLRAHVSRIDMVVYTLASATFTELIMFVAVPFSVLFARPKEQSYRPGAQLLVGAQRFAFIVYLSLLAVSFGAYRVAGWIGLALLLLIARGGLVLRLPTLVAYLLERRRLEATGAL